MSSRTQILDKSDYKKQFVVTVAVVEPPTPLSAGAIRIRSRILSVTTNTFTYARLGDTIGTWNVFPYPAALPSPFSDASKYGRVSSWGCAEVVESRHDQVPVGSKLFGFMPISDSPEVLSVNVEHATGHVIETSERRQHLWNYYNRYLPVPPETDFVRDRDSLAWDSLMRPLFETAHLLNRYGFAWDDKISHPLGDAASGPWTEAQANHVVGAVVLLLGPSGKTGLAFAHQLRHGRPAHQQPKSVIAVGSASSRAFSRDTGLFDDVLLYEDAGNPEVVEAKLGVRRDTKVLIVNFGARGDADLDWVTASKRLSDRVLTVIVGGDPEGQGRPKLVTLASEDPASGVVQNNASFLRDAAMAVDGPAAYFERLGQHWAAFQEGGGVKGLQLRWGRGIDAFGEGWEALAHGRVDPIVCLAYEV